MGKQLFGTDGIRGVPGEFPLDDATLVRVGAALGHYLKDAPAAAANGRKRVLIGRDTRESGMHIEECIARGLAATGTEAFSSGVLTTPGVAWMVRNEGFAAGVVISASHNPYHDNGVKLVSSSGMKFPDAIEAEIEEELMPSDYVAVPFNEAVARFGYSGAQEVDFLRAAGLAASITEVDSRGHPAGSIVSVTPPPGSVMPASQQVTVAVARGNTPDPEWSLSAYERSVAVRTAKEVQAGVKGTFIGATAIASNGRVPGWDSQHACGDGRLVRIRLVWKADANFVHSGVPGGPPDGPRKALLVTIDPVTGNMFSRVRLIGASAQLPTRLCCTAAGHGDNESLATSAVRRDRYRRRAGPPSRAMCRGGLSSRSDQLAALPAEVGTLG